jgi:hypothetical protein
MQLALLLLLLAVQDGSSMSPVAFYSAPVLL